MCGSLRNGNVDFIRTKQIGFFMKVKRKKRVCVFKGQKIDFIKIRLSEKNYNYIQVLLGILEECDENPKDIRKGKLKGIARKIEAFLKKGAKNGK